MLKYKSMCYPPSLIAATGTADSPMFSLQMPSISSVPAQALDNTMSRKQHPLYSWQHSPAAMELH